jgi:hypothetical protein
MAKGIAQRRAEKAARRKKQLAARRKAAGGEARLSLADRMRHAAATAPIDTCLSHADLFDSGAGHLILTRKSADGGVSAAVFFLDVLAVGIKDVIVHQGGATETEAMVEEVEEIEALVPVDPAYARKLLRDLVAWSRSIGLPLHPDYATADLLFGSVSADDCVESFTFGREGRPVYVPGSDTPAQIRQRTNALRRTLGADGFDFAVVDNLADDDAEYGDDDVEDVIAEGDAAIEEATGIVYDPDVAPDVEAWNALDDDEKRMLVESFHRRARIKLPNLKVHAIMHVVIENQVALGDDLPVRRAIERLMGEGLDRHDAVHAVASVLAGHFHDLAKGNIAEVNASAAYNAAVERLTAASWHAELGPSDEDEER